MQYSIWVRWSATIKRNCAKKEKEEADPANGKDREQGSEGATSTDAVVNKAVESVENKSASADAKVAVPFQ